MSENGKPPDNGILCLSEVREGTVTQANDDDVEVAYAIDPDDPARRLEGKLFRYQTYDRRQFIAQPQENDRVRVVVSMWLRPPEPKGMDFRTVGGGPPST